jgi:nucleoid-associated protein YgaU
MISSLSAPPSPEAASFDDLLVVLATWVLRGCACWAALIVVAAVVEAVTSGQVRATSWVATPPAVRRALLAGLGVLLAGVAPGPVSAAVVIGASHRPEPLSVPRAEPLPVPERPVGTVRPRTVLVRPGDSLWGLAARRLPRGADDAAVLAAEHRWYARNRAVIGPDPDLLRPGQRLSPPRPQARPHPRPIEESR